MSVCRVPLPQMLNIHSGVVICSSRGLFSFGLSRPARSYLNVKRTTFADMAKFSTAERLLDETYGVGCNGNRRVVVVMLSRTPQEFQIAPGAAIFPVPECCLSIG